MEGVSEVTAKEERLETPERLILVIVVECKDVPTHAERIDVEEHLEDHDGA